jgi:hypothetical protein
MSQNSVINDTLILSIQSIVYLYNVVVFCVLGRLFKPLQRDRIISLGSREAKLAFVQCILFRPTYSTQPRHPLRSAFTRHREPRQSLCFTLTRHHDPRLSIRFALTHHNESRHSVCLSLI